jgi:hypothetical protein
VLGRLELQPQHWKGKSGTEVFASEAHRPRIRHFQNASQSGLRQRVSARCRMVYKSNNGHIFVLLEVGTGCPVSVAPARRPV